MSERAPSIPPTPEAAPPSPEGTVSAELETSAENLERAANAGPDFADLEKSASNLENALDSSGKPKERPPMEQENPLGLTEEEQNTKIWFENIQELRISIREKATPRINSIESAMNAVQSKGDKIAKKALLLEYREGSKQRKATRLGAKLEKATPGSRRHRRLLYKYGKANRKLGEVRAHVSRLDNAAEIRDREHERKKMLREREIELRRDMLKVEKKVAQERKTRRRLTQEMKETVNGTRREMLKREIAEWQSIGKFRQGLLDEAIRKNKNRGDKKKKGKK